MHITNYGTQYDFGKANTTKTENVIRKIKNKVMKNFTTIFAAVILSLLSNIVTAVTSGFTMVTTENQTIEVVSKNETELNEKTPDHHLTVKEYIELNIELLSLPKYVEKELNEEDFQPCCKTVEEFRTKEQNLDITDFVQKEEPIIPGHTSIDTRAIFENRIINKGNKIFNTEILADFIRHEKEINELTPSNNLSLNYITR